jgi:aquaporin-9
MLVLFGLGGTAESVLSEGSDGEALSSHIAWGLSFMFSVYVSASVSGGHLNPAVSFTMCVHKRMEWRVLPGESYRVCVAVDSTRVWQQVHRCVMFHVLSYLSVLLRGLGYIFAQIWGAFLASCVIYGVYNDGIKHQFDARLPITQGGATLFVPFPPEFVSTTNAFFDSVRDK